MISTFDDGVRLILFLTIVSFIEVLTALLVSHNPNDIHFYLYPDPDFPNYSQEIVFQNDETLASSNFRRNVYTVFLLHGYNNVGDPDLLQPLKDAYLNSGIYGNIIIMNWYALTTVQPIAVEIALGYVEVTTNVPVAARRLAEFVSWIVSRGYVQLENLHFVGHSLGAHASGEAGLLLQSYFPGSKVPRITGMDPAGPLFYPPAAVRNINYGDATFVDIYHSNRGMLGEFTFEGQVDFVLNDGKFQPNCSDFTTFPPGKCSHAYSVFFFAYSINHAITGCLETPGYECVQPVLAGEYVPPTTRGIYCVVGGPLNFDCAATWCPSFMIQSKVKDGHGQSNPPFIRRLINMS